MDLTVLRPENQEAVLEFERRRCEKSQPDAVERELASWKARWRPEQLTHYLSLGWSFGAWKDGRLQGFVLAQPLLFFRGLTQTLWIETISYEERSVGEALLDCAYRWARDKHFQTVLFSEMPEDLKLSLRMDWMKDRIMEIPASRMR